MEKLIQVIHIPRTGISSLRSSVVRGLHDGTGPVHCSATLNWEDILDYDQPIDLGLIDILIAHLPFRSATIIKNTKVTRYTFVREPIARTISALNHCITTKPQPGSRVLREFDVSENNEEFLTRCLELQINCDVMTKQLCGLELVSNCVLTDKELFTGEIYSPRHQSRLRFSHDTMGLWVDKAETNLRNHFEFVGSTEKFNESMETFCKLPGLSRHSDLEIRNITPTLNGKFLNFDNTCMDILREMNRYDLMLYERIGDML